MTENRDAEEQEDSVLERSVRQAQFPCQFFECNAYACFWRADQRLQEKDVMLFFGNLSAFASLRERHGCTPSSVGIVTA